MKLLTGTILAITLSLATAGCVRVKTDPIEVHVTVDVNIRVDQQLNDFFAFEKDAKKPSK